jgi:hypothetical protein
MAEIVEAIPVGPLFPGEWFTVARWSQCDRCGVVA